MGVYSPSYPLSPPTWSSKEVCYHSIQNHSTSVLSLSVTHSTSDNNKHLGSICHTSLVSQLDSLLVFHSLGWCSINISYRHTQHTITGYSLPPQAVRNSNNTFCWKHVCVCVSVTVCFQRAKDSNHISRCRLLSLHSLTSSTIILEEAHVLPLQQTSQIKYEYMIASCWATNFELFYYEWSS